MKYFINMNVHSINGDPIIIKYDGVKYYWYGIGHNEWYRGTNSLVSGDVHEITEEELFLEMI